MVATHPSLGRARPNPGPNRALQDRVSAAGVVSSAGRLPWPVMAYMVAVLLPVGFNLGPLYMTGLRLFLLVMIVPLIVKLLRGDMGRIIWTDILFFAHIAWAMVAIAVNNPEMVVQNIGSAAVEFLGGYLVGRAYIRSRADFVALCRFLGVAILCMAPLAIYETLTGKPLIIEIIKRLPGVTSLLNVNAERRLGLERVQVVFTNPIHFGLFASTAVSLIFVAMKGVKLAAPRLLIMAAVALCVFLSLSSGAFLSMVLQIILIVWGLTFRRTGKPWLLLLITFAIAYVAIDLLSNRTPIRVFLSYATFSAHTAYWRSIIFEWGMINVWANPVYGLGLNDWVRPFFMYSGSMDNFWLVMAVRYGIPGFALIAVGYLLSLWRIGRRDFSADPELARLRRAWMFAFVGLTFTLCTVHIWTTIYSYVFFLYGAGIWFITAEANTGEPVASPAGPSALQNPYSRSFQVPNPAIADPPGSRDGTADPASPDKIGFTRFPPHPPRQRA